MSHQKLGKLEVIQVKRMFDPDEAAFILVVVIRLKKY